MNLPMRGFRERREAQALQDALERYERALGEGVDAGQARVDAGYGLGELARPFVLATSMADAATEITPDPAFARRVAMQIREAPLARREVARRTAPRFRLAPLAAAAAVLVAALVLIPSFGSLPGESLYAVKGAAEDARVWFASGPREARIRLSLANERFEEVEQLIDNSHVRVMGGPGILAAAVDLTDIDDPALAQLIEGALRNAGEQLEAAAQILTEEPATQQDLDDLVEVTTRGRTLATEVADELPNREQPPVYRAAVRLAKIEAKAKAAQQQQTDRTAEPTLEPCPTPSASPSPSPTPEPADGTPTPSASPTLTPGVDETQPTPTPTPEASTNPSTDPCATTEPTATPSPTPATDGTDASTAPSPTTPTDQQASTVDETDDGEPSSVSEEPRETHRRPLSPFGQQA
jgi:hypothetical protein